VQVDQGLALFERQADCLLGLRQGQLDGVKHCYPAHLRDGVRKLGGGEGGDEFKSRRMASKFSVAVNN